MESLPARSTTLRKGDRTRGLILDAAERAFAAHDYDGVSVRDIAARANQPVGVVTYHFASKEGLFEAVVARRATELIELRQAAMLSRPDQSLESHLDSFFRPLLDAIQRGDEGWRHYAQLMARISQDQRFTPLAGRIFGEYAQAYIAQTRAVLPGLSPDAAVRGYVHVLALMVGFFSPTDLQSQLSDGALHSTDYERNYWTLLRFAAGGLRALVSGGE